MIWVAWARIAAIFCATHSRPSAESIRPYLSSTVLEQIPDLEEHRVPIKVGMASEVNPIPSEVAILFWDVEPGSVASPFGTSCL